MTWGKMCAGDEKNGGGSGAAVGASEQNGRLAREDKRIDRVGNIPRANPEAHTETEQRQGGPAAVGRDTDVQNGAAAGLEQPVGRKHGVHDKRPFDVPAVSGADTGREGAGRKDDLAVQGADRPGGHAGAVRNIQQTAPRDRHGQTGGEPGGRVVRGRAAAAEQPGGKRDDQGRGDTGGMDERGPKDAAQGQPEGHRSTMGEKRERIALRVQRPCKSGQG